MTETLQLVEALECDFELQGRAALGTHQRNENAGIEPTLAGGVDFLVN
jgi:hypothetical protein